MDMKEQKEEMLLSIRDYLLTRGIRENKKIIRAISKIDRKFFMPKSLRSQAYLDEAMPIGKGQTISQPSTVARMLSLLELRKGDKVLEIGAGSGWNASLIAEIVKPGRVRALDIVPELVKKSKENASRFRLKNLEIGLGDFRRLKEKFDKIVFTCGITEEYEDKIIKYAEEHLNNKGILLSPHQFGPLMIVKKDKTGKVTKTQTSEDYVFVPLILD